MKNCVDCNIEFEPEHKILKRCKDCRNKIIEKRKGFKMFKKQKD